jgi:SAM-dependent methyltransferase
MSSSAGARYLDGTYLADNPDWHSADSGFKADEAAKVLPPAVLEDWRRREALRVCEIGCGAGGVLAGLREALATRGVRVAATGYDISPQAIALARERHPELELRCEDFLAGEETYDLGLLIDVLEHLDDPAAFLAAAAPRLEHVLAHIPLEQNLYAWVRGQQERRRREVGHLHFFHRRSAVALLEGAGYEVLAWRYTADLRDQGASWRGRVFNALLQLGLRLAPELAVHTLGCASLMVLCRRRSPARPPC